MNKMKTRRPTDSGIFSAIQINEEASKNGTGMKKYQKKIKLTIFFQKELHFGQEDIFWERLY